MHTIKQMYEMMKLKRLKAGSEGWGNERDRERDSLREGMENSRYEYNNNRKMPSCMQ